MSADAMANLELAREPLLNYAMLSTRRVNDRLRLCKLLLLIFFSVFEAKQFFVFFNV